VLIDLQGPEERLLRIREEAARAAGNGQTVGFLCASETARQLGRVGCVQELGSRNSLREVAANLFWALRELDNKGCDIILAEGFPRTGYGLAIMDRLSRAADEIIS
jgi:L-threonylcarbamoyladenylate synthase